MGTLDDELPDDETGTRGPTPTVMIRVTKEGGGYRAVGPGPGSGKGASPAEAIGKLIIASPQTFNLRVEDLS